MLIDRARSYAAPLLRQIVQPAPVRTLSTLQIGMRWSGNGFGGADRVFFDLFNALPAQGILTRGLVVEPADVARLTAGKIRALAPEGSGLAGRLIGARGNIARHVESGDYDLVASHFALHVGTAVGRLRDRPFVMHFHGPWAAESRQEGQGRIAVAGKRALENHVYRRADRFIVLSKAFATVLTDRYGIDRGRIRVVPGSVGLAKLDTATTKNDARDILGWPRDRRILLSVRRLAARMGLDRLIGAMVSVVRTQPDVLLFIAGRGRLEAALRAQVKESGLQNHVRFLGFIPEATLPLAYRAADINIVPTIALEGFGLTAAEALAAGTPSMVTPVGGLPEVVRDLSPDLVFSSCDVRDLAVGLVAALRGELNMPNAAACRFYAEARFNTTLAATRTAAIYRELTE